MECIEGAVQYGVFDGSFSYWSFLTIVYFKLHNEDIKLGLSNKIAISRLSIYNFLQTNDRSAVKCEMY
jgi:hypothetical protein